MNISTIKYELQNILSGKSEVSNGEPIQAIARYLRESSGTSEKTQENESSKSEETKELISYINAHHLWSCDINFGLFISAGAEQRVFIKNPRKVLKLNDSIYYASWLDYFNNLLLNNYFFPDTAYNLVGFYKSDTEILSKCPIINTEHGMSKCLIANYLCQFRVAIIYDDLLIRIGRTKLCRINTSNGSESSKSVFTS